MIFRNTTFFTSHVDADLHELPKSSQPVDHDEDTTWDEDDDWDDDDDDDD